MKVFISWSGDTAKKLAKVLKDWIPAVLQAARPYYSPDDIEKGARWATEISKELDASCIGLICLTRDNIEAPWIMFESGSLSKKFDKSHVCPILFGIEPAELKGPLVQFQASKFSKNDVHELVKMMNNELGDNALSETVLNSVYDKWWPDLEQQVAEILAAAGTTTTTSKARPDRDILEEILQITRSASKSPTPATLIPPMSLASILDRYATLLTSLWSQPNFLQQMKHARALLRAMWHLAKDYDHDSLDTITRLNESISSAEKTFNDELPF